MQSKFLKRLNSYPQSYLKGQYFFVKQALESMGEKRAIKNRKEFLEKTT